MTLVNPGGAIFTVQTQPVRAVNTVYQNTGGKPRMVVAGILMAANGCYYLCIDSVDPPINQVAWAGGLNGCYGTLVGVVPAGYYYKVILSAGAGSSITSWNEYD